MCNGLFILIEKIDNITAISRGVKTNWNSMDNNRVCFVRQV